MAAKKPVGARSETVRCENCGEYYATTYKRCPFCEERVADRRSRRSDDEYEDYDVFDDGYDDEYEDDEPRSHGGKRLVTNARGGGYGRGPSPLHIILTIFSLALIGAAIWIVVSFIVPIVQKGDPGPVPSVDPSTPVSVSPTPSQDPSPDPDPTTEPTAEPSQEPGGLIPSPEPSDEIPASQTATAFTLVNYAGKTVQDISLSDAYPDFTFRVNFSPSGSTGTITWTSSKSDVVAVDQNGRLTPVSKGNATITATMAGGYSQSCLVRNNVTSSGSAAAEPSADPGTSPSSLSLNVGLGLDGKSYDFSLPVGDSWTLKVKGTSSTPTWSVKDASIATVDGSGKVSAVSKGSTTITVTVDGQTLTCLVRCT